MMGQHEVTFEERKKRERESCRQGGGSGWSV